MKILAVDVGTGTQDILLFDSDKEVENCYKLVLPSPTVMLAERIRAATKRGDGVLLTGVLMGGGPCTWAARDHARAGYPLWVTPDAARTFDDEPNRVEAMGATIVSEDEAAALNGRVTRLLMGDFDYRAITDAFARFGVDLDSELAAIAVAVFDHGNAPPGVSDRLFRFEYIERRLKNRNSLTSFAHLAEDVPEIMTRMEAAARTAHAARPDLPVDTTNQVVVSPRTADQVPLLRILTERAERIRHVVLVGGIAAVGFNKKVHIIIDAPTNVPRIVAGAGITHRGLGRSLSAHRRLAMPRQRHDRYFRNAYVKLIVFDKIATCIVAVIHARPGHCAHPVRDRIKVR